MNDKYTYLLKLFRISILLITITSLCIFETLSQSDVIVKGKVTDGKNPISGAIVKWQAAQNKIITDQNGQFEILLSNKTKSNLITAAKKGFFNGGIEYKNENDNKNIEIVLNPLPERDNTEYEFVDPVPNLNDDIKNCGDCHASIIYKQWANNAHSKSATNPIFFNLYNGTDAEGKQNIQPGFKLDYENSNGNCGNCHAPVKAINNFNNVDMNNLKGVEKLGVSCDFCHKIKDVKLSSNSSAYTGVMQYELLRPADGHQTFFGPYTDVLDPYIFSETISQSIFCAPCHQGGYWGVPIYDSYDQWLKSDYAKKGVTCQDCHMPPESIITNFASGKGGVERDPSTIYSHKLLGSRDSSFLASAVQMSVKSSIKNDKIFVDVEVENSGAGHHVPTDQPMRNIILVVRVFDPDERELKYIGENIIPFWGGRGDVKEGNYEGFPGKGFAKILFEDWTQYERIRVGPKSQQIFPAPQWRTVQIKYDTRIPALQTDTSKYVFKLNKRKGTFLVDCKLIYRRTFKSWAAMKKWNLKDIVIAENKIKLIN